LETLQRAGHAVPEDLWEADDLTRYAVETRYPGIGQPVTEDDYRKALALAERVLTWAQQALGKRDNCGTT
jgi:HEPN domain-containing protein